MLPRGKQLARIEKALTKLSNQMAGLQRAYARLEERHEKEIVELRKRRREDLAGLAKLTNTLCAIACSCVGTDAAESGFGLEPERHEEQCGYRLALIPAVESPA